MAIQLTNEEMQLVREGKLDPMNIEEHRKVNPIRTIDVNELDSIKNEIRETNILYKNSIQKNKELYDLLVQNRKEKEQFRNKIAELRLKKKQIMGLE